jgi:hypothetical protein
MPVVLILAKVQSTFLLFEITSDFVSGFACVDKIGLTPALRCSGQLPAEHSAMNEDFCH